MLRDTNRFCPQITGPGLSLTVGSGKVYLSGSNTILSLPSSQVNLTANATNYVYLLYASQAVVANTTGFPLNSYPIATVVTTTSGIRSLIDQRADCLA